MRLSQDLCKHARSRLVEGRILSQAELRRATSDCYYAMFHAICEALVEPFEDVKKTMSKNRMNLLERIYRTPGHRALTKRASSIGNDFSEEFLEFAGHLISMRGKRENADYNAFDEVKIETVRSDIHLTVLAVEAFWNSDADERVDFTYSLVAPFHDRP